MAKALDTLLDELSPPTRPAPTDTALIRLQGWGELIDDACRVYVFRDVLEELHFAAQSGESRSCLLTGSWYIDEGNRFEYVQIEGFRELIPIEDSMAFSNYLRANRGLLRSTAQERVVGVCHMRPGSGALLSAADALCHRSFFNYSYQISFLLDVQRDRCCVYLIDAQQSLRDCGLFVLSQRRAAVAQEPGVALQQEQGFELARQSGSDVEGVVQETK